MRPTLHVVSVLCVLTVGLALAQAPAPKPNGANQAGADAAKQANIDALKKRLDEKEAEVKAKTEERDRNAERDASLPPRPSERVFQDDELFGLLFACGMSPAICYVLHEGTGEDDPYSQLSPSNPLVSPPRYAYRNALVSSQEELDKLNKELGDLQYKYYEAGGGEGYSTILKYSRSSAPIEEQQQLNEEYKAAELKRRQEANDAKSKPPAGPQPPPPPPISMSFDTPHWDLASHVLAREVPSVSADSHVALVLESSWWSGAPPPYATFSNAPLYDQSQGEDAVIEESGVPIVVERAPYWPQDGDPGASAPVAFAMLRPGSSARARLGQRSAATVLPRPSAKVFFTSLGGSTGEIIQMTVVNDGNVPIRVVSDGFALVPLANVTAADVERELQRLADKPRTTVNIRAYCRDLRKPPPVAGRVMRLADAATQAQMAPFQRVLAASRRLLDSGILKPDVDRELFLDSVRQWARWTMAERFSQGSFITAFIEHTKKNTIAAGQKWEKTFDTEARQIAGERWRDVQRVLSEALR